MITKTTVSERWLLLGFIAIFFLYVAITPNTAPPGKYDRTCWITWSNYIYNNGLQNIYKFGVDYPPLYHYILYAYAVLQGGDTESIILGINKIKYITLFFEVVGGYFLYLIVRGSFKTNWKAFSSTLFLLFNIAYFYNNIIYGQIDGIYTCLSFISVYYAIKEKPGISLLALTLALNLKIQALIFIPLILLLNTNKFVGEFSIKNIIKWALPAFVAQACILLPFYLAGDLLVVINVIKTSIGRYTYVSMGAYNLWALIFNEPFQMHDGFGIGGLSYNTIGFLFFCLFSFITLWPTFSNIALGIILKQKPKKISTEKALLIGTILPIIFFYFNTQMHSRYIHSAILFAGAYALYSKHYIPYILISLAYFLNIEGAAKIFKGDILPYKIFIFQPNIVSLLYLLTLISLLVILYTTKKQKHYY